MNAFEKYLLSIELGDAVLHVIQCLRGYDGQEAWKLMENTFGPDWEFKPRDLYQQIEIAIVRLGQSNT